MRCKKTFGSQLSGIVENTENSHQKYEKYLSSEQKNPPFPYPIISVARSELKDPEDFLVGQSIVFSAEAILRAPGEILSGRRALVIGYGKIGRSIAQNLHAKAVRVDIIDCNPTRQVLALAHGHQTGEKRVLLRHNDLIFCATGNRSLTPVDMKFIKRDAYVFTATSADDELENHTSLARTEIDHDGHRLTQIRIDDNRFFLTNSGNAVNFIHGAVVEPYIKLVQAELVFAAAQISSFSDTGRILQLSNPSKCFIASLWLDHFRKS
jgi:adenosylhomocysteinase